ncbi:hypothetical protein GH5_01575 [Leishmania sp. Ghana 2012 LV757]|uniref:hypothetical protein n=1 Tax=Leishmania sp. Ghana 2012 LV757 TaxID=2803181 RepID=UPI001B4AD743|nr:hypothetical protein GH5_01575 [Leishmania sp. Ghana 2012 LV757]
MSSDSAVNAALLNLCAQLQDSGARPTTREAPAALHTDGGCGEVVPLSSTSAAACPAAPEAGASAAVAELARPSSDYEWLRNALASVEAPEKRIKQLLFNMENQTAEGSPGPLTQEERVESLAEMAEMVEDVNWAAEFALMQGPQRLLQVLRRERAAHPLLSISTADSDAHVEAAEGTDTAEGEAPRCTRSANASSRVPLFAGFAMVVAHSAQLNEPVQAAYQVARWEDIILPLIGDCIKALQALVLLVSGGEAVDRGVGSAESSSSAAEIMPLLHLLGAMLHACSCLCRDCAPNTIVFIQSNGLAVVVEALRLTQTLPESLLMSEAMAGRAPVAVTNIALGAASDEEVADTDAPLLRATHKVAARAFFFVAYLASTGVSSEDIIRLTCLHAESRSSDETLQKAAARALLALLEKSPQSIKEFAHTLMPRRMKEWRTHLQRVEGDGATEDERRQFVDAIDQMS